jgi:hypothetical protein
MTLKQISVLGRKLSLFLALSADCFGRSDAGGLLRIYVKGQLSNLLRTTAGAVGDRTGRLTWVEVDRKDSDLFHTTTLVVGIA